jgi:hypothetical protein
MSEKMMKREPDQALSITAGLVTVTSLFAMVWCFADGWMREPGWQSMGLPGLFFDPNMRTVVRFVLCITSSLFRHSVIIVYRLSHLNNPGISSSLDRHFINFSKFLD